MVLLSCSLSVSPVGRQSHAVTQPTAPAGLVDAHIKDFQWPCPLNLTQNLLCRQLRWSTQRQFQKKCNGGETTVTDTCKVTWSATARANLSILEPASAIFLAALITSEEFFRGPLPLGKSKEWERRRNTMWVELQRQRACSFPLKSEPTPVSHRLVQQLICCGWQEEYHRNISIKQ